MSGEAEKTFIDTFERERNGLPGAGLDWLAQRRAQALEYFRSAGLPHRRLEDWHYTDLRQALDKASFSTAPAGKSAIMLPEEKLSTSVFASIERHVAVFVNGRLRPDLSRLDDLPAGVLRPLGEALNEPFVHATLEAPRVEAVLSLNTALMADGIFLHLAKGKKLDKPLHILSIAADDGASHTRHLIRLEDGAEATIFETHIASGAQAYFVDLVTDISLGKGAKLERISVQDEEEKSIHLSTLDAHLDERASLASHTLVLGGGLSRGQSLIRFSGEHAKARINAALALSESQHSDHFCVMDHAVPHCDSATLFKSVMDGRSTGAFQGKVIVRPDAQKTDARQMTNSLLLSRDAAMNAKPELEIYADDVQCAHGATIGELSREALFYLRSRGIDPETARQLLISAFLDEVFVTIEHEEAAEGLRGLVAAWFGGHGDAVKGAAQ